MTAGLPVFKKHIFDAGYNRTFYLPPWKPLGDSDDFKGPFSPNVHRSVTFESRFTAGLIQDSAGAPLAERFLGGNAVRPFVQDDSWIIQSDAFIRSIPENRLGAMSATQFGGTRFWSLNTTTSLVGLGRAMLPKELAENTDFPGALNAAFGTAASALAATLQTSDPDYIRLTAAVPDRANDLNDRINSLQAALASIPTALAAQPAFAKPLAAISDNLLDSGGAAILLTTGADPQVMKRLGSQLLPALAAQVQDVSALLRTSGQAAIADRIDPLMAAIKSLGAQIDVEDTVSVARFKTQAWQEIGPGHGALDVFLKQLNIYSISPVVIFDAARVTPAAQGVRYGVGPGLRLSMVNVNFTIAYAVNPHRAPGEKAGAFFFKVDVSSLF
jgi:hypothetical protein